MQLVITLMVIAQSRTPHLKGVPLCLNLKMIQANEITVMNPNPLWADECIMTRLV